MAAVHSDQSAGTLGMLDVQQLMLQGSSSFRQSRSLSGVSKIEVAPFHSQLLLISYCYVRKTIKYLDLMQDCA